MNRRARRIAAGVVAVIVSGLLLAGCGSSHVVRRAPAGNAPVSVSTPKPGVTTTVQRGQNLYRIAADNGITLRDLAAWNGIPAPYTIHPGQRLRLYPGAGNSTPSKPRATTGTASPRPRAPPPKPRAAPPRAPFAWQWPADGALLSRYQAGDPTRQGVDIAGSEGAPVRAAADGVVVYSGSGLVGYGELVIVKHNDQWLSAYGHNRARLVSEGALVKAGQQIAEIGHSGAARDMLHFEIRYNGKPVDPQDYLPKK